MFKLAQVKQEHYQNVFPISLDKYLIRQSRAWSEKALAILERLGAGRPRLKSSLSYRVQGLPLSPIYHRRLLLWEKVGEGTTLSSLDVKCVHDTIHLTVGAYLLPHPQCHICNFLFQKSWRPSVRVGQVGRDLKNEGR